MTTKIPNKLDRIPEWRRERGEELANFIRRSASGYTFSEIVRHFPGASSATVRNILQDARVVCGAFSEGNILCGRGVNARYTWVDDTRKTEFESWNLTNLRDLATRHDVSAGQFRAIASRATDEEAEVWESTANNYEAFVKSSRHALKVSERIHHERVTRERNAAADPERPLRDKGELARVRKLGGYSEATPRKRRTRKLDNTSYDDA